MKQQIIGDDQGLTTTLFDVLELLQRIFPTSI